MYIFIRHRTLITPTLEIHKIARQRTHIPANEPTMPHVIDYQV